MAETKVEIGLSPEEVIASLAKMGDEVKKFQEIIQDAIGKKSSQSINDLKDNAEKGTNQITKFFSNMGTRIREDLKTAFDLSSIVAGANFAKQIQEGVKSVLDMERAFDRLNVRMGLSARQMEEFKRSAGRATSEAGVKIQDVQPGLLSAASRGNVKDPQQMSMIAGVLAQARQINPELETGTAMDDVAEILKRQHLEVNGENVRKTFDAINAATVSGGFKNSNDAASNIAQMSGSASMLGLDTRGLAGLASIASKSGDTGENILRQILTKGTGLDRGQAFNAQVGADVFKDGKLDAKALGSIDTSKFGNISPQVLEKITGVSGASGADFKQFVETMRDSLGDFDKVVNGSNETADQFGVATNNFAAKIDMFKARVTNAGAEIGNSLIEMASGVIHQDTTNKGASHLMGTLTNSAGDLAMAGGLSVGAAMLTGGGIRGLLGAKMADAQGIQKVYVTNAGEINPSAKGMIGKAWDIGKKALGGIAAAEVGVGASAGLAAAGIAGAVGIGGTVGYGLGKYVVNPLLGNNGQLGDMAADWWNGDQSQSSDRGTPKMSPEQMANVMAAGYLKAMQQHEGSRPKYVTNPSAPPQRGAR